MSSKTNAGNYFEDFHLGQEIRHATPRTVTQGDVALYTSLFGSRFALTSSDRFAQNLGLERAPLDSLLVFNTVFGKTVPDISLNAIANLGYAQGRFGALVYPGDTLSASSEVTGLRQTRDGKTGVVYVRSTGVNQHGDMVVDYCRWVLVPKRDPTTPPPKTQVPDLPEAVSAGELPMPFKGSEGYEQALAGSPYRFEDYDVGEKIDHVDGMTIEEAEHMMATRLYQNTARVHFNQHVEKAGRFGRRIIYGGYILSLARSLTFNGLANGIRVVAINGGRHANPTFAGDTVYAWSEVLDKFDLPGPGGFGALRVRTVATKNLPCHDFPLKDEQGKYHPEVVLDFDYTTLIPKRDGSA